MQQHNFPSRKASRPRAILKHSRKQMHKRNKHYLLQTRFQRKTLRRIQITNFRKLRKNKHFHIQRKTKKRKKCF